METKNLISLNELAKKLNVNKSYLNYYAWLKLIKPIMIAGKTMLFDKKYIIERLNIIKKYKKQHKSLKEIQKILK